MRIALVLLGLVGCATPEAVRPTPPEEPLTRAEATDYRETSRYSDVLALLDALPPDAGVHRTTFGTTGEGRALPLVVWGAPDASPDAVRRTGKVRVLVVGAIHAGEVAGKEAALQLVRALARGRHRAWADSLVLLVAPIYNADGTERVALDNRPRQLGPVGGMGQRPNAAGLDLNRDFTKLASLEARALVGVLRDYDPHVVLDLHTTNGTHMGYQLTYAPPLSPNTPPAVDALLRDRWLPAVSERLRGEGFETYHYGNVPGAFGEATTAPRGWYSFSAQPRFSTNYAGLRGRLGILSEAYSYAPFEVRVDVSRRFVEAVVDRAWADASAVREATAAADREPLVGRPQAVRSTWAALPEPVEIVLGAVDTVAHPVTGAPMLRQRDERRPERMPAYVRFAPSESVTAPAAYVVRPGPHLAAVRALLDGHGIRYRQERAAGTERFALDSVRVAPRPFQGVRMREAFGTWRPVDADPSPSALVVPVDQALGRLVVALFEPRSDDGVVAWGIVPVDGGRAVPIERVP